MNDRDQGESTVRSRFDLVIQVNAVHTSLVVANLPGVYGEVTIAVPGIVCIIEFGLGRNINRLSIYQLVSIWHADSTHSRRRHPHTKTQDCRLITNQEA